MPVTRDRVDAELGVDVEVFPLHSFNRQFLPRAQEHSPILDLGVEDVDVATEAA
jgi:hypothetical protein